MKKSNSFFIAFILTTNVSFSEDASINCASGVQETVGKSNEGLAGCDAAIIALKSDPLADEQYRKKIDKKLASSIALQTKQILRDLGGASSFFEQNSKSFFTGKDSSGVANACRFDFLKELEKNGCNGKINSIEKEKIATLLEALNEGVSYHSKSLQEGVAHLYGLTKYGQGVDSTNTNQCPLSISYFPAESQLTATAINKIFKEFKSTASEAVAKEMIFQSYPQLALIYHANKYDPNFLSKFEKYMANFSGSEADQKKYLTNFLFNEENRSTLGKGVAHRCEQVRTNVSTFVCGNLDEISPKNSKNAKILFDDYNIKKEFQDQKKDIRANPDAYRTYGYLCESKSKNNLRGSPNATITTGQDNSSQSLCLDLKTKNNNIDNWYNCFNQDVRTERNKESEGQEIANFCSRWSCKDELAKATKSCKEGGPITSSDLASLGLKDTYVEGQVDFLKSIQDRKDAKDKYLAIINSGEPITEEVRNSLGLSEFDLNLFGADTVMKFAGLPSTPIILASVTQDMHDKGIKPSTPEEIREVITRATNLAPKVASNSSDDDFNMTPTIASTPAVASASNWKNTNYIKPEPSPIAKTKHKIVEPPSKRNPEVQQMMDDLQEIMKAGKGTSGADDSDEAASTSFSGGSSASANSKKQAKTIQGLTSSDLETWAQKLKAKETTLNFRETLADQRDAEYWRNKALSEGGEKEKGRSIASVDEKDSQGKSGGSTQATLSSDSGKAKTKAELAAEVSASSSGLIVTPEKLDKLEKMDLKNFGVNIEEPFVISVRMNGKLIHVRVAKVEMKGREFLAPRLTDDNKEAKEVILNSPLFKEFRYFYEKENSSYFPVKSANN